jgi:hypothetical protein
MRAPVVTAFLAVLVLASGPASAQVSVRNTTLGKAPIDGASAAPGSDVTKVGMNIVDVELGFPVFIRPGENGKLTLLGGSLGFRQQDFLYDRPAGAAGYQLERVSGERWTTVAFAGTGAFSDLEDFRGKDLLYNGGVFLVRNMNASWQLGGGIVATYAFGDPVVLPVPYVNYRGQGRLLLDLRPPEYVLLGYRFSPRFEAGVVTRLLYDNYQLGNARARDADGRRTSVVFSDATVGVETRWVVAGPVRLDVGLARTFARTLEIRNDNRDTLSESELQHTWVLSTGLSLVMSQPGL